MEPQFENFWADMSSAEQLKGECESGNALEL